MELREGERLSNLQGEFNCIRSAGGNAATVIEICALQPRHGTTKRSLSWLVAPRGRVPVAGGSRRVSGDQNFHDPDIPTDSLPNGSFASLSPNWSVLSSPGALSFGLVFPILSFISEPGPLLTVPISDGFFSLNAAQLVKDNVSDKRQESINLAIMAHLRMVGVSWDVRFPILLSRSLVPVRRPLLGIDLELNRREAGDPAGARSRLSHVAGDIRKTLARARPGITLPNPQPGRRSSGRVNPPGQIQPNPRAFGIACRHNGGFLTHALALLEIYRYRYVSLAAGGDLRIIAGGAPSAHCDFLDQQDRVPGVSDLEGVFILVSGLNVSEVVGGLGNLGDGARTRLGNRRGSGAHCGYAAR